MGVEAVVIAGAEAALDALVLALTDVDPDSDAGLGDASAAASAVDAPDEAPELCAGKWVALATTDEAASRVSA